MSLIITLPDHVNVYRRIEAAKTLTDSEIQKIMERSAALLEVVIKTLISSETRGSGLTAASIETRREGDRQLGVGSYTRGLVLRFLDRGTGIYRSGSAYVIQPKTALALHFFAKESGDEVYAAMCVAMGLLPFYFLERAWQQVAPEIDRSVTSMEVFKT